MKADTHIHTKDYSADARMSFNELLNQCENHPGAVFCCSEHYDYDYPVKEIALVFEPEEYYKGFFRIKSEYEDNHRTDFPILFGAEIGYIDHLKNHYETFAASYPFDNIIASIHTIDDCDPFHQRDYYDRGKESAYSEYLKRLIFMAGEFGAYDAIGHYDYICRYAPYDDPRMLYRDFSDYFDELFSLLVRNQKALEFNSGTSARFKKRGMTDYMPDPEIFRRYYSAGGRLITFGSDAHDTEGIFELYDESVTFLKKAGFSQLAYYKARAAVYIDI